VLLWEGHDFTAEKVGVALDFGWRSGSPPRFRILGGAAVYRCENWLIFIDGFSR
jgi:hypothetical protein